VKEVLVKQAGGSSALAGGAGSGKGLGKMVAVHVVACARVVFGGDESGGAILELLGVAAGKWKGKVEVGFEELLRR
jgi:hypothetical protein